MLSKFKFKFISCEEYQKYNAKYLSFITTDITGFLNTINQTYNITRNMYVNYMNSHNNENLLCFYVAKFKTHQNSMGPGGSMS